MSVMAFNGVHGVRADFLERPAPGLGVYSAVVLTFPKEREDLLAKPHLEFQQTMMRAADVAGAKPTAWVTVAGALTPRLTSEAPNLYFAGNMRSQLLRSFKILAGQPGRVALQMLALMPKTVR